MNYVYVTLGPRQRSLIKEFLNAEDFKKYVSGRGWPLPPPVMEDEMQFCNHQSAVGVSYGGTKDFAFTFCLWLAQKLGKSSFWDRGEVKIPVGKARYFNARWSPNRKDAPDFPEATLKELRKEHKVMNRRLGRMVDRLDEIWNNFH